MRSFRQLTLAFLILPILISVASAGEVMTDRCSAEVAFPPQYGDKPNTKDTQILARGSDGATPWSAPFTVQTDSSGQIRWWCHSTTGNMFDLGTLRVTGISPAGVAACITAVGATVATAGTAAAGLAACVKVLNFGSSAWDGWTAEQSRCGDHSTRIRAKLGPDRLLQTECLGK
jgi:hypothetical protein